jgi:hypothetical protein
LQNKASLQNKACLQNEASEHYVLEFELVSPSNFEQLSFEFELVSPSKYEQLLFEHIRPDVIGSL